jgi:high-affinity K+ transport system ATPase subunit B
LTELAVEATSLSADTPEAEAVMIRAGADDVKDVSGNTEVAAQVVLVRKDILEPAESWIRSWVPLREGRTVVFTA